MGAYWTAFLFRTEPDPNKLHVTHKYIGDLTEFDAKTVEILIADHFRKMPLRPFSVRFDKPAQFGADGNVRVLLESDRRKIFRSYSEFNWFDDLRAKLDAYREDDFPDFVPHVSTPNHTLINSEIDAYALMQDEKIVRLWKAEALGARFANAKGIAIRPIREDTKDADEIEKRAKNVFKELLYGPLLKILGAPSDLKFSNAKDSWLEKAIKKGTVSFHKGRFEGKFSAAVTRELKEIGAQWDGASFKIRKAALPDEIRSAVNVSESNLKRTIDKIDSELRKNLPEKISESIKTKDIFEKSAWKVDKDIAKTLEHLTVSPTLNKKQRSKIAEEWQSNMGLYIKDFAETEIVSLRKAIQKSAFAGNRYEGMIEAIQKSYGVSERKARFLARQETNLLTAKLKETRYKAAGVNSYRWRCVAGSPNHPVRPSHKILEGKMFNWDNPPITTAPDQPARRNNPGQDYNCRCFAQPVVKFSESS